MRSLLVLYKNKKNSKDFEICNQISPVISYPLTENIPGNNSNLVTQCPNECSNELVNG